MAKKYSVNEQKLAQLERIVNNQTIYQVGDEISWEEVCLLAQLPTQAIKGVGIFPATKGTDTFKVEYQCKNCGDFFYSEESKSAISRNASSSRCAKCAKRKQQREQSIARKKQREQEEEKAKNEAKCKEAVLQMIDPRCSWIKNSSPSERWQSLWDRYQELEPNSRIEIANQIKELDYYDFLKTPYWQAIAAHIRWKYRYKCALCSEKQNLRVHHKTYAHHGYEIEFLDDLILLCDDCHKKFHEVEE